MAISKQIAPYIFQIVSKLQEAGYETYLVGGAVRDLLIKREPKDYDISTAATPEQVQARYRVHIFVDFWNFELAMRREEERFPADWKVLPHILTKEAVKAIDPTAVGVYEELCSKVVFWHLNQAATRSTSFTSTPSLNFTPVITLVK